ncbi:hypothetical protein [Rhizobacter sp. LjRoot28]|uniref:hypothetical protein n=1 Tax=Rhizobacter sp. LjRoot28 TaxID=3342309 RepID=UPI003F507A0D
MADMTSVNAGLIALWKEKTPAPPLWPLLHENFATEGFLSVGLNPSFSEDNAKGWSYLKSVPELEALRKSPRAHFTWNATDTGNFVLEHSLLVERHARERHQFYRPLRELHAAISKSHPMGWHHADIFFYRETDHTTLEGELFKTIPRESETPQLTEFGASQFQLFERLLEAGRPKVVVIFNALASRIYLDRRNATLREDESLGCHLDMVAGRHIPVLLSGFPTYMDRFSKARLEWHMRHVLAQLAGKTV